MLRIVIYCFFTKITEVHLSVFVADYFMKISPHCVHKLSIQYFTACDSRTNLNYILIAMFVMSSNISFRQTLKAALHLPDVFLGGHLSSLLTG